MKSTINLENTKTKSKYPCLKISTYDKAIVLFTAPLSGVALTDGKCTVKGEYSLTWTESIFEPFNGTVTLSND